MSLVYHNQKLREGQKQKRRGYPNNSSLTMAPASRSPRGIEIGKNRKWKVGEKLGSGACATVYTVETVAGEPTEYAVKIAPIPSKRTKKSNSPEEVNDRYLAHEALTYQTQFPHLQGIFLPNLPPPKGPPITGEIEGFRYLTMERMESPLSDVAGLLVQNYASDSKISVGPVAVRLLQCVQAIHEAKNVVVDVKPENFMLAYPETKSKRKSKNFAEQLANRIKILDMALVQPWGSMGKLRDNETGKTLAGTPMYASINVHNGETPSRRDDLEAIGYVLAEILMQIAAMSGGGRSSKKAAENLLPWSHGKSDEEIGEIKQAQVEDSKSLFYSSLGDANAARVIRKYMDEVLGYTFKKIPDYDSLKGILQQLDVSVSKAQKPPAKKRAPPKKTVRATPVVTKRVTRSRGNISEESSDEKESPSKVARTIIDIDSDSEDDEVWDDAQDETVYWDAHEDAGAVEMDWEITRDENDDPVDGKPRAQVGVVVHVDNGPHAGLAIELIKGTSESLVIGSNPKSKDGELKMTLSQDSGVDASHVRLDLNVTKKLVSVIATDLNSSGLYVGSEKIKKGKEYRIFRNQEFCIGESTISIKTLSNPKSKSPAPPVVDFSVEPEGSSTHAELPRLKRRGVRLEITEGPHKGESFELESGGVDSLIIGSKPTKSSKTKESMRLGKDEEIGGNHIRLELEASKRLTAVKVIDLKSKGSTQVNRMVVGKGKDAKAFMNDTIRIGQTSIKIATL